LDRLQVGKKKKAKPGNMCVKKWVRKKEKQRGSVGKPESWGKTRVVGRGAEPVKNMVTSRGRNGEVTRWNATENGKKNAALAQEKDGKVFSGHGRFGLNSGSKLKKTLWSIRVREIGGAGRKPKKERVEPNREQRQGSARFLFFLESWDVGRSQT